jgi:MFS family permease
MTFAAYRAILAHGSFRRFWLGFTGSVLGDGMTRVALTWFVYAATGSARAVGWLLLCYTGPVIVGGLLAGALLDRYDRRRVMIADNVIRGAAVAAVPLLAATGRLALWHVYVVAASYGLLMMLSLAGGPSLIPALVQEEQLPTANAMEMLSFTLGGVAGPPLAGLLIPIFGAPNIVIVDALSYAAFALALARIRLAIPPVAHPTGSAQAPGLGQAVRLLLGNQVLLATTMMFMAFNIGGGFLAVWLPVLADRILGGGAGLYGVFLGILAAGEAVGALLAGGVALPLTLGVAICLAQALSGAALLMLLPLRTVWGVALGLALFGASSAPLTVWAQTLRMHIIPERLRGRTFALLRTIMQGGAPVGGALGGLLVPALGIPAMIALSALVAGAPGLLGLFSRELRRADRRRVAASDTTSPAIVLAEE